MKPNYRKVNDGKDEKNIKRLIDEQNKIINDFDKIEKSLIDNPLKENCNRKNIVVLAPEKKEKNQKKQIKKKTTKTKSSYDETLDISNISDISESKSSRKRSKSKSRSTSNKNKKRSKSRSRTYKSKSRSKTYKSKKCSYKIKTVVKKDKKGKGKTIYAMKEIIRKC